MSAKVLIGWPTYFRHAYAFERHLTALRKIDYKNFDIITIDNSDDEEKHFQWIKEQGVPVLRDTTKGLSRYKLANSRNMIRQTAIDGNYDFLLLIDQDIIVESSILKKLMANQKDIVTGIYFNRMEKNGEVRTIPMAFIDTKGEGKVTHLPVKEAFIDQTIPIRSCGLGLMLLSRKAFTTLNFDYKEEFTAGEDTHFCMQAYEKGFTIFADTRVKAKHLISEQKNKWIDTKL